MITQHSYSYNVLLAKSVVEFVQLIERVWLVNFRKISYTTLEKMVAAEYSSWLIGFGVILLLFVFAYLSSITREVSSWITWCYNIRHLRSLPSPSGGHWILGHGTEVSF